MLFALSVGTPLTVIHAETTENLLGSDWQTTGQVQTGDDYVRFTYTQGVAKQDIDLSAYDNIEQLTYGADFIGCNNYIGGSCNSTNAQYYDQVVVKLYVDSTVYEDTVTLNYNDGWVTHEWSVDVVNPASATLQFSGFDPGYWAGWYGAIVRNPYLTANYSWVILEPVVNPTTVAPNILTNIIDTPVSLDTSHIDMSLDVSPQVNTTSAIADVSSIDRLDSQAAADLPSEQVKSETTAAETDVTSKTSDIRSSDPSSNSPSDELKEQVAEVKVDSKNMDSKSIGSKFGNAYNPAAQSVMIALMSNQLIPAKQIKNTPFYIDPGLPEANVMRDKPWLGAFASEVKFEQMRDSQWQR
jgi:hypothetical protein